jgi:hypothetical protein
MYQEPVWVYFDGSTTSADANWNTADPSQSWALIMQRAVIQAVHDWDPSETIQNPHSGGAGDALAILTGRASQQISPQASNVQQQVEAALASNKAVVLGTNSPSTTTLVAAHCYAVLGATAQGVVLYNPWGYNTNKLGQPGVINLGEAGQNGVITVSWRVISQDGASFFTD